MDHNESVSIKTADGAGNNGFLGQGSAAPSRSKALLRVPAIAVTAFAHSLMGFIGEDHA